MPARAFVHRRESCQPFAIAVVSVGTVLSMRIVCSRHDVPLPATSNARVSSSCTPSSEIVKLLGPSWIGWPSIRHSTRSTPEPESVAETVIADVVSALVCRERLYHGLAKPFLHAEPVPPPEHQAKISA